jgi:type IV pilus assembly protein PilE
MTSRDHSNSTQGFTLVELMITILIAAILAAIAVPSYTSQVRKSRRTEARNAVLDAAAREERFFATNNKYSEASSDLGYGPTFPASIGGGYYKIGVACKDKTCAGFTVTATALGTQIKDALCANFLVDDTGKQSVTGTLANDVTAPCWN